MGRRQSSEPSHQHSQEQTFQVSAEKVIQRLRQQRADLHGQLDVVETALAEHQEQIQHLLARIAELEDAEDKKNG